eukprot:3562236-Prymnesium_polylepis.2
MELPNLASAPFDPENGGYPSSRESVSGVAAMARVATGSTLPVMLTPVAAIRCGSQPNTTDSYAMQLVLEPFRPQIPSHQRWILDGALLRKLYVRIEELRASAGRSKRKRAELAAAIVPPYIRRFVMVCFYQDGDDRTVFYICYGDSKSCSDTYFRLYEDLTVCTGVPERVYDGLPLASSGWAKLRRAVCARAVAVFWLGVAAESACAEGGRARSEDSLEFQSEFDRAVVWVTQTEERSAVLAVRVSGAAVGMGGAPAAARHGSLQWPLEAVYVRFPVSLAVTRCSTSLRARRFCLWAPTSDFQRPSSRKHAAASQGFTESRRTAVRRRRWLTCCSRTT